MLETVSWMRCGLGWPVDPCIDRMKSCLYNGPGDRLRLYFSPRTFFNAYNEGEAEPRNTNYTRRK